jgi:hypothetical protein
MTDFPSSPETETLKRERDEARQLVIEANNSLYGSQGYFHSLNGGEFDKYHLARGIEDLKARLRGHAQAPDLEATVSRIMRIRNGMIMDGDAEALIRKEIGGLMGGHAKRPAADIALFRDIDTTFQIVEREGVERIRNALADCPQRVRAILVSDTSAVRETGK